MIDKKDGDVSGMGAEKKSIKNKFSCYKELMIKPVSQNLNLSMKGYGKDLKGDSRDKDRRKSSELLVGVMNPCPFENC